MNENITREQLFQKIADASLFGNLNLFIGAGFSMAVFEDNEDSVMEGPLSWARLLDKICEKEEIILDNNDKQYSSCQEIASKISQKILENKTDGLTTLEEASNRLKTQISVLTAWYPNQRQRDDYSQILKNLEPNYIITTNYDLILENLLPENSISLGPNDILTSPKFEIPIYHLHGIRTDPSSIIITKEDYTKLFRPNEYRLQKLSLLFKESTTLIIGYSLGDPNVLTALDWSENVYQNNKIYYPNGVIQLLYKRENPNPQPIIQENGIITLEINSILNIIKELSDFIKSNKEKYNKEKLEINNFRNELINADDDFIKDFIDNKNKRIDCIDKVQNNSEFVIEAFLQLLTKVFDKCWSRALQKNNFKAYDEILVIVLDILLRIPFNKMSPALFGSVAYNLGRVSCYIGHNLGQSYAANGTWYRYKNDIQDAIKKELLLYYKQSPYQYSMKKLLE